MKVHVLDKLADRLLSSKYTGRCFNTRLIINKSDYIHRLETNENIHLMNYNVMANSEYNNSG